MTLDSAFPICALSLGSFPNGTFAFPVKLRHSTSCSALSTAGPPLPEKDVCPFRRLFVRSWARYYFELVVIERFRCHIYAFDPTPRSVYSGWSRQSKPPGLTC